MKNPTNTEHFLINYRQVAYILDCNQRTVQRYMDAETDPLPVEIRGKGRNPTLFDSRAVVDWVVRQRVGAAVDGTSYDLTAEKARLTHLQAELTQVKLDEERGDLVRVEIITQWIEQQIYTTKAHLLAIPDKCAHQFLGLNDLPVAAERLRENIHEALQNLSDRYRPKRKRSTENNDDAL